MIAFSFNRFNAVVLGCVVTTAACLAVRESTPAVGDPVTLEMPVTLDNWDLVQRQDLSERQSRILQASGQATGCFRCRRSGETVRVTLVDGAGGPLASHHPQLCYSHAEFRPCGDAIRWSPADTPHSFWIQSFHARRLDQSSATVGYAWHDGDHWRSPRWPRWQLAHCPRLRRLQVTVVHPASGEAKARETLERFLAQASVGALATCL